MSGWRVGSHPAVYCHLFPTQLEVPSSKPSINSRNRKEQQSVRSDAIVGIYTNGDSYDSSSGVGHHLSKASDDEETSFPRIGGTKGFYYFTMCVSRRGREAPSLSRPPPVL